MTAATKKRQRSTRPSELGQVPICVEMLHPSPENDLLYHPIDLNDPNFLALVDSIRRSGVKTPLVVTADMYVVSGHRRLAAAKLAGLRTVPCVFLDIERLKVSDERYIRLIREYNLQRDKTRDEQLREELMMVDPDEAYASLIEYRQRKAKVNYAPLELRSATKQSAISPAKWPFLNAVKTILQVQRQFWPLSDRQIHYFLLNDPPLKHASKPSSRYRNDQASYKSLTDLLSRARKQGFLPFESIADETRPLATWEVYDNPRTFLRNQLEHFLKGYWRNLQQSQPNHIEIVVEKNTIYSITKSVAGEYCIPVQSSRGFSSVPPRKDMAVRFERSGKEKLVLLMLTDFDPDGEEIAHNWAWSLQNEFNIENIHPIKVAITKEHIDRFSLVPNMEAKIGSANYKRFVRQHGKHVFELEAIPPVALQTLVRESIDSVLDIEAFNAELATEKKDAAWLDQKRQRAIKALMDTMSDEESTQ